MLGAQAEHALLLDRGRLGVALGHDDAAQRVAELAGHFLPRRLAEVVAAGNGAIRLGRREEDAPAVVRHLDVVEVGPALGIDRDRRTQVDLVGLEAAGTGILPPLQVVRLPLLERALKAAIARQVDVVGDLLVELHQVLLQSKLGRSGLP